MEKNIFLVRVNPIDWKWGDVLHNWDNIKEWANVSFDGACEEQKAIKKIKLHDIVVGYNMDSYEKPPERNKKVVCLGRVISNGCFESVGMLDKNNTRFLVQKAMNLKNPIDFVKEPYQPTVLKLSNEEWDSIKQRILDSEPNHKIEIDELERGWEDI